MNISVDGDDDREDWLPVVRDASLRFKQLEALGYRRTSRQFETRSGFSQHQTATAADYVPAVSQVGAFTTAAKRLGLQVVNEMDEKAARLRGSRDWTGPHMHVQIFPAKRTPAAMVRALPAQRRVRFTEVP